MIAFKLIENSKNYKEYKYRIFLVQKLKQSSGIKSRLAAGIGQNKLQFLSPLHINFASTSYS